jgi:2,4'-dihydroxyacetophenone dioxygenase
MSLDIAKELDKTLHLHTSDLPYVEVDKGMEMRVLHAWPEQNYYVTQIRAQPGCVGGLHQHPLGQHTSGFTLKGAWGHDHQYLYRPGTYVYETPGVVHQFLNGPEETEIVFFGSLGVEFVDPETLKVSREVPAHKLIQRYLEHCTEQGVVPKFLK